MGNHTDLVFSLNYATMQVNRHGAGFMLIFGTVGNLLNVRILNEHCLYQSPCSIYLRSSSISGVILLWSGLLTRVLQGYSVNWPNQNNPLCKIRLYFLSVAWAMAIWCLVGASIDRFLCSSLSNAYRQFSTEQMTRRFVIGILIFFVLLFVETIYCFEGSVPNVPVACYGRNLPCRIFNDWTSLSMDIILPSLFLFIFGSLTIRNIRSRFVRAPTNSVGPMNRNNNRLPIRINDRNLNRMLLVQVSIVFVLDLPFGIYRPYASLTSDLPKSTYRVAVENLIYSLIILLVYFTHSTAFYLYTLTGSLYRLALRRIARRYFKRIRPRCLHLTNI